MTVDMASIKLREAEALTEQGQTAQSGAEEPRQIRRQRQGEKECEPRPYLSHPR